MAASLAPVTPYASARHFVGADLRHRRLHEHPPCLELRVRITALAGHGATT